MGLHPLRNPPKALWIKTIVAVVRHGDTSNQFRNNTVPVQSTIASNL